MFTGASQPPNES